MYNEVCIQSYKINNKLVTIIIPTIDRYQSSPFVSHIKLYYYINFTSRAGDFLKCLLNKPLLLITCSYSVDILKYNNNNNIKLL